VFLRYFFGDPRSEIQAIHFILYLTVWGVEPVVTHQTFCLESTGVCGGKACETDLKGPLSMVSLHAAVAHGKPPLREQGVQPQGLLPVPLSLQIK